MAKVNFSTEPSELALKDVQSTASQLYVTEQYEQLKTPIQEEIIREITFNEKNLPVFHFRENSLVKLRIMCMEVRKGRYLRDRLSRW